MKTILWDEHQAPINGIPVIEKPTIKLEWFYIKDNDFNTFILYHNVAL